MVFMTARLTKTRRRDSPHDCIAVIPGAYAFVKVGETAMTLTEKMVAGVANMRPAVPARDCALSQKFYEALGFQVRSIAPNLSEITLGPYSFLLQDFYVAEYAGNFVMHMIVDDVDAWWRHIEPLDLTANFNVRPPTAPKVQPWGLKVLFLVDPAGVLWQIGQRP